ncbi:MAG TPA: segregation/condensation protein A, partial [Actinomycetota bacterium]|nr:segregation/condensation protein A [Actinomycetota bacterium]
EWVGAELAAGGRFFARDAGLEPQFAILAPDFLAGVSREALAVTAARLFEPQPEAEFDMSHVAPANVSVRDAMLDIARVVESAGAASFADLCGGATDKIDIVVRFLALLELFKAGAVDLQQAERFGDIRAQWTGEIAAAAAIEEVDEYAMTEGS